MINEINKLLFLDIETVGITKDLKSLEEKSPHLYKMWEESGYDYCKRRYQNDEHLSSDEMFIKKSALLPEFGKIICISVGFIVNDEDIKLDSFVGEEKEILENISKLFNRIDKLGFRLCGHNVKNFDLPYIGKKMLVYGLELPKIIPTYNDKPWETRVVDTKEVWNFNSYIGLSSLDLICASLGIDSPKSGEVKGENLHKFYYTSFDKDKLDENLQKIKEYCEKDVTSLINLVKKIS